MNTFFVLDRAMTDAEFARLKVGMEEDAREHGHSIPTRENYGCIALNGEIFIGCARGIASRHSSGYDSWCYLSDLYVEKPYRGQGLGAALLRRVEHRVEALGIGHIWTWTAGYEAPDSTGNKAMKSFANRTISILPDTAESACEKSLSLP